MSLSTIRFCNTVCMCSISRRCRRTNTVFVLWHLRLCQLNRLRTTRIINCSTRQSASTPATQHKSPSQIRCLYAIIRRPITQFPVARKRRPCSPTPHNNPTDRNRSIDIRFSSSILGRTGVKEVVNSVRSHIQITCDSCHSPERVGFRPQTAVAPLYRLEGGSTPNGRILFGSAVNIDRR